MSERKLYGLNNWLPYYVEGQWLDLPVKKEKRKEKLKGATKSWHFKKIPAVVEGVF